MQAIIRKKTKATKVLEALRADIANGVFAPNEKLQMEILKERYGIGYSPLREALSRLAANGLVQAEEQCGFCVAPLSLNELYDLYNVRTQIETLTLQSAIQHGDGRWEADIVACWHQYAKYLDPKSNTVFDPTEWEALQRNFLFTLVKACQSPWLLKIRDMLYDQADRYRSVCLNTHYQNKKFLRAVLEENESLVNAVLAKNSKQAIAISEACWQHTIDSIAAVLKEKNSMQI
jgi:GntR family carbon starvation induced transcriptional regulator